MLLVEQHIIRKTTPSKAKHWRQYNLYSDAKGADWIIKEFVGRAKNRMEMKKQRVYGVKHEADRDIQNLLDNHLNRGFEYIDRIVGNMADTPFSKFTPLANKCISVKEATEQELLNDETHRLIPIHGGIQCCIRIGYDTVFQVEAKTNDNRIIPLPDTVEKSLIKMISLSEYETFVLEAFVSKQDITIVDLLCLNGIIITKPLQQRLALLSTMMNSDTAFMQLTKPSKICLSPRSWEAKSSDAYYYAVKRLETSTDDIHDGVTKLIPQHFVFNVMASRIRNDILAYRNKQQDIKLMMSSHSTEKGHELIDVGTIRVPMGYPLHTIRLVECRGVKNGKLISPRVCKKAYDGDDLRKSCVQQLQRIDAHWAANFVTRTHSK